MGPSPARVFLFCFVLSPLFLAATHAQDAPPPKPKPPAEGSSPSSSTSKHSSSLPATIVIRADTPCKVAVDGESRGTLQTGQARKVDVKLGEHLVEADSLEGGFHWEQTFTLKEAGQIIVKTDLLNVKQAAQDKKEREEREAAAARQREADLAREKIEQEERQKEAVPHAQRAQQLLNDKRESDSLAEFKLAVQLDPGLAAQYQPIIQRLSDQMAAKYHAERGAQFRRQADEASQINNTELWEQLYGQATAEFRVAVRLDPSIAQWHLALAQCLPGRTLEREEEAQAALNLDPTLAPAYVLLGVDTAQVAPSADDDGARIRNWQRAEALFRKALDLNPNDAFSRGYLGRCLARQGRYPEAVNEYRRSLQLDPNSGWQNDLNEALGAMKKHSK
jgi:superkiller protein 3